MPSNTITWSNIQSICSSHKAFQDASFYLAPFISSLENWPTVDDLNRITIALHPNFPWTFVVQERVPRRAKSRGQSSLNGYVASISMQGKIPVREKNTHDFLNCLSFLMFPESKLQLNLRHHFESPSGLKPGENRTRTQDLLTIFDEGGVLRLTDADGYTSDLIFGHAIYEHVLEGKRIRAARLDLLVDEPLKGKIPLEFGHLADQAFARWLQNKDHCLSANEFSSLWIDP